MAWMARKPPIAIVDICDDVSLLWARGNQNKSEHNIFSSNVSTVRLRKQLIYDCLWHGKEKQMNEKLFFFIFVRIKSQWKKATACSMAKTHDWRRSIRMLPSKYCVCVVANFHSTLSYCVKKECLTRRKMLVS